MSGNAELQEALDTLDFEQWLDREGIRYKVTRGHHGRQANIRECPRCGSTKWKVYFGLDTGFGNCFSGDCDGQGFNKWSFMKAYMGGDNRATVENVKASAREQGWQPPKLAAAPTVEHGPLKLPKSVALPVNGRNLKYLDNRNIGGELARYFGLRYCHDGKFWWEEGGRKRFQDYSRRVIIPVFNLDGQLASFQGRDITGSADKKYLFPPGFASTGSILYNGHNAVGAREVCAGEGVFDVAAIKFALDGSLQTRHVVPIGTFGKHLSSGDADSQLAKLQQLQALGLQIITFMWDGEPAALEAAISAGLLCHGIGLKARLAELPADKDPNEVAPQVVRDAYWKARVINPTSAIELRMRCAKLAASAS
jgi:DNA primase